jgi:hypothetical protein
MLMILPGIARSSDSKGVLMTLVGVLVIIAIIIGVVWLIRALR